MFGGELRGIFDRGSEILEFFCAGFENPALLRGEKKT